MVGTQEIDPGEGILVLLINWLIVLRYFASVKIDLLDPLV